MARWRKQPSERGLASVCQSPRGFDLTEKGVELMVVRPRSAGFGTDRYKVESWYFLASRGCPGPTYNSLWDKREFATADEAKAAALAHLKAAKAAAENHANQGGAEE